MAPMLSGQTSISGVAFFASKSLLGIVQYSDKFRHSTVLRFNCIVLLIYCYVDIIQYSATQNFVRVLDNPPWGGRRETRVGSCQVSPRIWEITI